jgi:hypothetical protein
MKRGTKADTISNLINSTIFSPLETGVELTTDHRYLVNEAFKMFLHFAGQLSRNHESGNYDDRNEFACRCSKVMIEALEKADLYDRKFWESRYDEVIANSYE